MIPASELASMQAEATKSCDTAVTVSRNTPTKDAYGSQSANWGTVWSGNARFRTPSGPMLAQIATQIGAAVVWVVSFPVGADVRIEDRVVATGPTGSDTLTVHAAMQPHSYSVLNNFVCIEVR